MKIDRLVAILVLLLGKERVQAKDLSQKFEVSTRTILRDIEAINQAGIPIVTFQGANGGIGIAEGYRLDRSVLTGDEMAAIVSTLKGIDGAVSGRQHEILMEKLKKSMSAPQLEKLDAKLNRLVIDLSPWKEDEQTKEKLAEIVKAIDATQELELTYLDNESKRTIRRVEPYSLILKTQNWYLYAWCHLRNAFRYFRVSRIKELTNTGVLFKPRQIVPQNLPSERLWSQAGEMVTLELAFIEQMESILPDLFQEGIQGRRDGRIMVRTTLPDSLWMYGMLLSFGLGLEVISPIHVRQRLGEMARDISNTYL